VLFAHGDHFTAGLDLPTIAPAMQKGEKLWPQDAVEPLNLGSPGYRRRTKPMWSRCRASRSRSASS
jgi:enoyl-CoA hydratase